MGPLPGHARGRAVPCTSTPGPRPLGSLRGTPTSHISGVHTLILPEGSRQLSPTAEVRLDGPEPSGQEGGGTGEAAEAPEASLPRGALLRPPRALGPISGFAVSRVGSLRSGVGGDPAGETRVPPGSWARSGLAGGRHGWDWAVRVGEPLRKVGPSGPALPPPSHEALRLLTWPITPQLLPRQHCSGALFPAHWRLLSPRPRHLPCAHPALFHGSWDVPSEPGEQLRQGQACGLGCDWHLAGPAWPPPAPRPARLRGE